ncbi:MAG: hypothetical protein ABF820_09310, partial [Sporolactobacillus sp.]
PAEEGFDPAEEGFDPAEEGHNPAETRADPAEEGTDPAEVRLTLEKISTSPFLSRRCADFFLINGLADFE